MISIAQYPIRLPMEFANMNATTPMIVAMAISAVLRDVEVYVK